MKKLQFNLSTTVTFGKEESVSCIIKLAIDRRLVGGKGGGEGKGKVKGEGKGEGEGEGGGGVGRDGSEGPISLFPKILIILCNINM